MIQVSLVKKSVKESWDSEDYAAIEKKLDSEATPEQQRALNYGVWSLVEDQRKEKQEHLVMTNLTEFLRVGTVPDHCEKLNSLITALNRCKLLDERLAKDIKNFYILLHPEDHNDEEVNMARDETVKSEESKFYKSIKFFVLGQNVASECAKVMEQRNADAGFILDLAGLKDKIKQQEIDLTATTKVSFSH